MLSEARRRNNRNYQKKTKTILITYNAKEVEEYECIKSHCQNYNMTIQTYLKMLAREDMKHWN